MSVSSSLAVDVRAWNGTLASSRVLDAVSLLLPAGDTFLISTMEECLAQGGSRLDVHLRAEIERFIREERMHQKVHDRYNDAMLLSTPSIRPIAERAKHVADDLGALSLPTRLAFAAAFEYLTALLSQEMLHGSLLAPGASRQARVWRWHAREELGHCHVTVDVAKVFQVGRLRAGCVFVLASAYLGFDVIRYWWALCRCDVESGVPKWKSRWERLVLLAGGVRTLAPLALGWLKYFIPRARSF